MKQFSIQTCLITIMAMNLAQASMIELWDTKRLTNEAQDIRIGKIKSQWSAWDSQRRMIYTYTRLIVDETIKGKPQKEVLIRQPGGISKEKGLGMVVHGVAHFRLDEQALVFLKNDSDSAPSLIGMSQGKFRIQKDEQTGEDMATFSPPKDAEFYTHLADGSGHFLQVHHVDRRLLLRQLIDEIKQAMKENERR